jgi:hypothetical protein
VQHIKGLAAAHPEWVNDRFLNASGRAGLTHYAPELVTELKRMKQADEAHKPAPEGWVTLRVIAKQLSKTTNWAEKRIENILQDRPEWASDEYLDTRGHPNIRHYSPEIVAELERIKDSEGEIAPEGWMPKKSIAERISKSESWVAARLPALLSVHPEWKSDQYLTIQGIPGIIHYSPQLISELQRMSQAEGKASSQNRQKT